MTTYTKLRSGDWGLRGEGTPPSSGAAVEVTKRSGERKRETIERVLWQGNGAWIAAIEPSAPQRSRGRGRAYDREDCRKYGWDGVEGSPSYYSSGQYDEDS